MARKATDTKQKLIDTASMLIWKSSYGSVSVDDICKAADVKKGSFYHFFKSKSELAIASVEDHYEKSKPHYEAAFSRTHSPMQRFENITDHIISNQTRAAKKYGQVCGCPYATLGSEMAGQDEGIREKVDSILKRYEQYYVTAISDMVTDGELPKQTRIESLAAEVNSYMIGQVVMARIHNSLETLERDIKKGLFRMLESKAK